MVASVTISRLISQKDVQLLATIEGKGYLNEADFKDQPHDRRSD
jgi:hypothetical protein